MGKPKSSARQGRISLATCVAGIYFLALIEADGATRIIASTKLSRCVATVSLASGRAVRGGRRSKIAREGDMFQCESLFEWFSFAEILMIKHILPSHLRMRSWAGYALLVPAL